MPQGYGQGHELKNFHQKQCKIQASYPVQEQVLLNLLWDFGILCVDVITVHITILDVPLL